MNGIMGEENHSDNVQEEQHTEECSVSEVTDEMKEKLESKRRQNVGRPKKGKAVSKPKEIRATFIVDPELVRKVKYISIVEGTLLKDVVSAALTHILRIGKARTNQSVCQRKSSNTLHKDL